MALPLPDIGQDAYNQSQAALFDQQTKPLRDSLDTPGTPTPDLTLSPNQQTVQAGGTPSLRDRNLISNQFDYQTDQELTPAEAAAACGPTAALAFARYAGRNPTIGEALQLAKQNGWTPSLGMAGPQSEVSLLGALGVHSTYTPGYQAQDVANEVGQGRPVILDTPNHYYAVDDFNPQTGLFHVGGSGLALRGGSEWMSWNQIAQHGNGVRGAITVQSPSSLQPSSTFRQPVATAGVSGPTPGVSMAAPATVTPPPTAGALPLDFQSFAKQRLAEIDQSLSGVGSAVASAPQDFETFAKQTLAQIDSSLNGQSTSPQNASQTAPDAATGPIGPAGYNDMVGASSGAQGAPAGAGLSSLQSQPPGIQAPQAAVPEPSAGYNDLAGAASWQPDLSSLPGYGGVQPAEGANPLLNLANAGINEINQGTAAWTPSATGGYTPEQTQQQVQRFVTGLGTLTTPESDVVAPVAEEASNAASKVAEAVNPESLLGAGPSSGGVPPLNEAPPAAAAPLGPDARAGNILLRKFNPDIQPIIADAAAQNPDLMEAARRGVVSDQTVQELAQAAGTTVQKVIQRWKPGDAANAETLVAMRAALSSKADDIVNLTDAVKANPSTANLLNLQVALREQQGIQQAVSGVTAEAGRGLRALRATVQSAVQSGDAGEMSRLLDRLGGTEWTQELATKLSQLDPTDALGRYQFIRDALKPQLKDYLTELWYNSMLSGPHTFLVKSLSEATSLALSPVERVASAAADIPLAALQDRPRARFFGEAPANAVGMVQGIREGAEKGLFTLQHGFTQSDVLGTDYIRRQAFRGPLGATINFPSRLLAAGAEMAGSIAQAGALNANAYRIASQEGKTGAGLTERMAQLRENPTPALLQAATLEGRYRTYQAAPGPWLRQALALRNQDVLGLPIGRIIVPFAQTPANLAKFGLERSPLGVLKILDPKTRQALAAADPEIADRIGRWALGSAIATAAGLEVGAGNITGAAPTVPAQRDAWAREGKQPFSIKIGNNWVSYQKLEPLNQTLSQVAAVVDAVQNGGDPGSAAAQAVATIGANLASQSYMQSLSNALAAIRDPGRGAALFTQGLASSIVPGALRTVAQIQDPTYRQVQGPLEAMESDIPGLSQRLPPTLTAFGQPRPREVSNISPISVSPSHVDPVDTELSRLGVEPGLTGKTLRGIALTRQEEAAHQTIAGQLVKRNLDALVADPQYRGLPDWVKARALQLAITRAKDAAANQYVAQLIQQQGQDAIVKRMQAKRQSIVAAP